MARCEDWPCCGHEAGCCPDFDESGRQLNMRCTCGAEVPLSSRSSLCESCLRRGSEEDGDWDDHYREDDDFDDEPDVDETNYDPYAGCDAREDFGDYDGSMFGWD